MLGNVVRDRVFFRFDYGGQIGQGHLSRCLALAEMFQKQGLIPNFIIRKRPSNFTDQPTFKTIWLSPTTDVATDNVEVWRTRSEIEEAKELDSILPPSSVIVLDHYGLGLDFQRYLKDQGHKIVLLQDIFNKNFAADIVINYNVNANSFYSENFIRANPATQFLIGPEYAPINQAYSQEHELRYSLPHKVQDVGLYFGGVDSALLTLVAKALVMVDFFSDKKIHWIVNSEKEKSLLAPVFPKENAKFYMQLPSLIPLYKKVDLFLGSCGVSFIERACMGLRQINFVVAENQMEIADFIIKNNLGAVLGDLRSISAIDLASSLEEAVIASPTDLYRQVTSAFNAIDGKGAIRIVKRCLEVIK